MILKPKYTNFFLLKGDGCVPLRWWSSGCNESSGRPAAAPPLSAVCSFYLVLPRAGNLPQTLPWGTVLAAEKLQKQAASQWIPDNDKFTCVQKGEKKDWRGPASPGTGPVLFLYFLNWHSWLTMCEFLLYNNVAQLYIHSCVHVC